MSSVIVASVAFVCMFGGSLIGMLLAHLLPEHHLRDQSKDAVKLGTGMIATIAALVLGLLIASAKGTFETMTNELRQVGAKIVLLDRAMARYGPETGETRNLLRRSVDDKLKQIWPEEMKKIAIAQIDRSGSSIEAVQDQLRQLSPQNDAQRWLQSRALQLTSEISDTSAILVEQVGQTSLATPFLVILIFWLMIIFLSFGMFSDRNPTVLIAFLVCALSAAGALFLIMELDYPYEGIIKVSSAPLRHALAHLGQ